MSLCSPDNSEKKIGGYDPWKVRSAVSTMREAAEIEEDPKFLKVVAKEMDREAVRDIQKVTLLQKTSAKLKATFGGKK